MEQARLWVTRPSRCCMCSLYKVPRVVGSIPPGPHIVYCSFDCNEPAECHLLFVSITSEYCTELYCALLYCYITVAPVIVILKHVNALPTCWIKLQSSPGLCLISTTPTKRLICVSLSRGMKICPSELAKVWCEKTSMGRPQAYHLVSSHQTLAC